MNGFALFALLCVSACFPETALGKTLTFDAVPLDGKFHSTYEEQGMQVHSRDCPESLLRDSLGRSDKSEPGCQIFSPKIGGNGAIRISEAANSHYTFSYGGSPFDLIGFDIIELSGTGEIVASNGARVAFSSQDAKYKRFGFGKRPQPYRFVLSGDGWKGITWFRLRDAGGGATLDNLEFSASDNPQ